MTIVVSDTSSICYLLLIDQIDLLPQLYGNVTIPQAVSEELAAASSLAVLQNWIGQPPNWLEIRRVELLLDPTLEKLDPGEQEAIFLGEQLRADLVVLDDKAARQIAQARGLKIIGLLGILRDAARAGLIELKPTIERLQNTDFRVAPSLLRRLIEEERR